MLKIAITGKIATGKTTVSKISKKMDYKVFDSDVEVANLYKTDSIIDLVLGKFSHKISSLLLDDGKLNMSNLGSYVFKNPEELEKLEKILYPKLKKKKDYFYLKNKNEKALFYDIPLLFQKNLQSLYTQIILTTVNKDIQKRRALLRNNMNNSKLENILKIQEYNEKFFQKDISLTVDTSKNIEETKKTLKDFLKKLKI